MSKYRSLTHSTYNICCHVVFCPKYRFKYLRKYPSQWTRSYFAEFVGHIHLPVKTREISRLLS